MVTTTEVLTLSPILHDRLVLCLKTQRVGSKYRIFLCVFTHKNRYLSESHLQDGSTQARHYDEAHRTEKQERAVDPFRQHKDAARNKRSQRYCQGSHDAARKVPLLLIPVHASHGTFQNSDHRYGVTKQKPCHGYVFRTRCSSTQYGHVLLTGGRGINTGLRVPGVSSTFVKESVFSRRISPHAHVRPQRHRCDHKTTSTTVETASRWMSPLLSSRWYITCSPCRCCCGRTPHQCPTTTTPHGLDISPRRRWRLGHRCRCVGHWYVERCGERNRLFDKGAAKAR